MDSEKNYKQALLGTRARRRLVIPDTDLEVELRILSNHEVIDVHAAKKTFLQSRNLLDNQLCDAIEENVQVTFRSALIPETNEKFFKSPEDVRDLSQEHLFFIADQYRILSDESNPSIKDLSEEDLEKLKKKLLSGEDLIGLSYFQLLSLTNHLVEHPVTSEQLAKYSSDADQEESQNSSGSSSSSSTEISEESTQSDSSSQETKTETEQEKAPIVQQISPTS
jgi:hypothetical protein